MPPISAVIITKNEAAVLDRCLESVALVADEIVVVDSESTDDTVAIAEARRAVVSVRPWEGYAATRNVGARLASHDFILSIDADELLSPELVAEINALKPTLQGIYNGRGWHRLSGRWIRHCGWAQARKTILFDRRVGPWTGAVHEHIAAQPGTVVNELEARFIHYGPLTLTALAGRMNQYSSLECERSIEQGKRVGLRHLTLHPLREFFRIYVREQGFRDGFAGYCIAVVWSVHEFLWMAKLWESTRLRPESSDPPP